MTASDDDEAFAVLDQHDVDVVLSQIRMPAAAGLQFLRRSKQIAPLTEIVVAAATLEHDSAVECVKSGAFGYIQRPYGINDLVATLERALEHRQLRSESALYQMSRVIIDTQEPNRLPEVIVKVAMDAMVERAMRLRSRSGVSRALASSMARLVSSIFSSWGIGSDCSA